MNELKISFDIWCANCGAKGKASKVRRGDDFLCSDCDNEFDERTDKILKDAGKTGVRYAFILPPPKNYNSLTGEKIKDDK